MPNLEEGSDFAKDNGKLTVTKPPTVKDQPPAEADSTVVHLDSFSGAVQRILDSGRKSNADTQYQLRCLITGSVAAMNREQLVAEALPLLYDVILCGRGRGLEALFLTVMSAAQRFAPDTYRGVANRLPALNIKKGGAGYDMFCDLSMEGKALFSRIESEALADLLRALSLNPLIDVGALARGAIPLASTEHEAGELPTPSTAKRLNSGTGYADCVIGFTVGGWIVGGVGGALIGAGPASVGTGITGAIAGANFGLNLGKFVCGYSSRRGREAEMIGGPQLGGTDVGLPGRWIWPLPIPPLPAPWPLPLPRPAPLPWFPLPFEPDSWPRSIVDWRQPVGIVGRETERHEAGMQTNLDLVQRILASTPNLLIEVLGSDRILVHSIAAGNTTGRSA